MIPVTQTKVVVKSSDNRTVVNGNCWAAAIASILEVPITEVPNFETWFHIDNSVYHWLTYAWLKSKGWILETDDRFKCFHKELCKSWTNGKAKEYRQLLKDEYYFISGQSPRGVCHVTIWKNGKMVHDPHPTRDGILELTYFERIRKFTQEEKDELFENRTINVPIILDPLNFNN